MLHNSFINIFAPSIVQRTFIGGVYLGSNACLDKKIGKHDIKQRHPKQPRGIQGLDVGGGEGLAAAGGKRDK